MNNPLPDEIIAKASTENPSVVPKYQEEAFKYQLECLKLEIDLAERVLSRVETITQTVKNFAVITWVAVVTVFAGHDDLRGYIIFTAMLPLLFWLLDAWWVHLNRGASVRLRKIAEFLNGEQLANSFKEGKLIDFTILDVLGRQYKGTKEYERLTSFKRILRFKEMIFLYGGLFTFSILLGIIMLVIF